MKCAVAAGLNRTLPFLSWIFCIFSALLTILLLSSPLSSVINMATATTATATTATATATTVDISVDYTTIILDALETMRLGELATADAGARFKALAYKKAADAIRRSGKPITRIEDVRGIAGVGKKIELKIAEILSTGTLRAAERVKARTDVGAYEQLLRIHGVGPVKARELVKAGYTSIAALREAVERDPTILNDTQKLGLRYYEDGLERIPRAEMAAHESLLLAAFAAPLSGTIVGSYRRGAASSGDIDMLVTYGDGVTPRVAQAKFAEAVDTLSKSGYIVAKLVSGSKKWMGYVRLEGAVRRLDLLLTPPAEYAYAILYFTGSDKFNIAFRRWCLDHGYSINEHTLKIVKEGVAPVPPMTTEEDIFTFVGLCYVAPTERVDEAQIVACGSRT